MTFSLLNYQILQRGPNIYNDFIFINIFYSHRGRFGVIEKK